MPQTFHIPGAGLVDVGFGSPEAAEDWASDIVDQIVAIQVRKKFYNENQVQLGRKAGTNSGNGYLEAMIPPKLWKAMEAKDPEFFTDEKKWEKFLRDHSYLKLDLPLTQFPTT